MKFLKELIFLIAITFSINANASPLTDENINQFLVMYSNDYATHSMRLVKGFKRYKDNFDYKSYTSFKNNEWLPKYKLEIAIYDNVLETNRKYLFDNGLTFLISNMSNLSLRANEMYFVLKNKDKNKFKPLSNLIQSDLVRLLDLFKERGIEFKPLVRN